MSSCLKRCYGFFRSLFCCCFSSNSSDISSEEKKVTECAIKRIRLAGGLFCEFDHARVKNDLRNVTTFNENELEAAVNVIYDQLPEEASKQEVWEKMQVVISNFSDKTRASHDLLGSQNYREDGLINKNKQSRTIRDLSADEIAQIASDVNQTGRKQTVSSDQFV